MRTLICILTFGSSQPTRSEPRRVRRDPCRVSRRYPIRAGRWFDSGRRIFCWKPTVHRSTEATEGASKLTPQSRLTPTQTLTLTLTLTVVAQPASRPHHNVSFAEVCHCPVSPSSLMLTGVIIVNCCPMLSPLWPSWLA
jgi:hypothetical protein